MAKHPPTLYFFRTLPKPNKSNPVWGVYTLLMEKANHPARLYVGSGTNADHGVVTRLRNYKRETLLPQLVLKALQEGYSISHAGLLCWCARPKPGQAPIARLRIVAVKATMAFVFFAGRPCKMDVLLDDMFPWTRHEVSWQPLCTHTSGLLCWHNLPSAAHVPRARVRLLAVEAVLTFVFFAGRTCAMDVLWEDMLPWRREQVAWEPLAIAIKATMTFVFFAGRRATWMSSGRPCFHEVSWEPLCTHTAFLEKPLGDFNMSEAELESYNANRRDRTLAKMKVNSRAFEDKEKAISLEAYRARKRKEKLAWTSNNRGRVHQHAKTTRTNVTEMEVS
ncbi:hypothetical protein GCG54_00004915 [Colletotrichum gloeosporioides]|uniref:Uncharacterized protein n=1 Tax=Colletotrichum gloeosporioides TaxID=474922 RepID=A0A8H4FJ42_COLGL|nr:uncharacterized protein GCG54_00004915 [Colletotrichum gloeosporioides]KAF3803736.1 hypothetical protein GCG54_00004915 [Colletotrichum gloeosporioides]